MKGVPCSHKFPKFAVIAALVVLSFIAAVFLSGDYVQADGLSLSDGGGAVTVTIFVDFRCNARFDQGTDVPIPGATVKVKLANGASRLNTADENGKVVVTGIELIEDQAIEIEVLDVPAPTWMQHDGFIPKACQTDKRQLKRYNFNINDGTFAEVAIGYRPQVSGQQ